MKTELERSIEDAVDHDGFAVLGDGVEASLIEELGAEVATVSSGGHERGVYERRGTVYALRNLFDLAPGAKKVLEAPVLRGVVRGILGPDAFCVRGLFLSKTPRASWKVPWHQDATVAVKERVEVTGFGPWSFKGGAQHVMAPPGTLSAMLTVRVHLDDCEEEHGMVKVIPSSHQYGRLPEDSLSQFTRYDATACPVRKGGLLVMRPLLLHASGAASGPGPRRVIQLDFANRRLPMPLEWREAFPVPA